VWLVAQGFASQADETKWLGACVTAIGLSWSFYDKYAKAQALKQARALAGQPAAP
jgi:nicotinamide riboside transporter PnuC